MLLMRSTQKELPDAEENFYDSISFTGSCKLRLCRPSVPRHWTNTLIEEVLSKWLRKTDPIDTWSIWPVWNSVYIYIYIYLSIYLSIFRPIWFKLVSGLLIFPTNPILSPLGPQVRSFAFRLHVLRLSRKFHVCFKLQQQNYTRTEIWTSRQLLPGTYPSIWVPGRRSPQFQRHGTSKKSISLKT